MRAVVATLLVVALPGPVGAQEPWTYRVRFQAEQASTRSNDDSPIPQSERWRSDQFFVLSGDGAWDPHERIRFGGSASLTATGSGNVDGRLREGYGRGSAASWLDVEAGKRIVRWGVGYGFAPAGVLDPPRKPTDPTDRLQLNEGRTMVKADLYRGETAVSLAATSDLGAARIGTVVPGGTEVGFIGAAGSDAAPRYAATVTHVIGQQLELHGEAMSHQNRGERTVSASAGLQYTFASGLNLVVEYHRNGQGLTDEEWNAVRNGRRRAEIPLARKNAWFARVARTGNDLLLAPDAIVIFSADDGSWTIVPSITWAPRGHLQFYARATRLWGTDASLARFAPASTTLTAGGSVRF